MINKSEAINIIKQITKNYNEEYTEIYISKELLDIFDIKDAMGTKIFEEENNKKGWLLFVNPLIIANWSHRCEYYFIISKDEIISNTNCNWFPNNEHEKI